MSKIANGLPLHQIKDKGLVTKIRAAMEQDDIPYGKCDYYPPGEQGSISVWVDLSLFPKRRWWMYIEGQRKPTEIIIGEEYELYRAEDD